MRGTEETETDDDSSSIIINKSANTLSHLLMTFWWCWSRAPLFCYVATWFSSGTNFTRLAKQQLDGREDQKFTSAKMTPGHAWVLKRAKKPPLVN